MAADIRLSVEGVEQAAGESVACVVRCLAGSVVPGDVLDTAIAVDGAERSVKLRVATIWRYGRTVDLLDPPHTARVKLVGGSAGSLTHIRELRGIGTE